MKDRPRTDRKHRWVQLKCGEYVVTTTTHSLDFDTSVTCPKHNKKERIVSAEGPKDLGDLLRF